MKVRCIRSAGGLGPKSGYVYEVLLIVHSAEHPGGNIPSSGPLEQRGYILRLNNAYPYVWDFDRFEVIE